MSIEKGSNIGKNRPETHEDKEKKDLEEEKNYKKCWGVYKA